jgi:hypothetical protein
MFCCVQDIVNASLEEQKEKKGSTVAHNCSTSKSSFICHLSGEMSYFSLDCS